MMILATAGAEVVGGLAGQTFGQQGQRTVVAIAGAVAHPGQTLWADGVEIPLVDGEIAAAEAAGL
jgi:outer membrane lipoprotein SlyB